MIANLCTIVRRELNAYYTSAIAYITIIVFLSLTIGLYMAPFFTVLSADMRVFFTVLPIVLCVFLPAVSMRLWAEERKQNTWELLLTFPMRAYEMVLGKFLASLIFYLSALAGTLVLPAMLLWLGKPDFGPILGAYFGSLLLGVFFLSLGSFISALCRDQIVAFMLTLLGCFGFFLAGTEFVVTLAEAAWPGLGTLLAEVIGVTQHYMTFTRGLLVIGDVAYFLIWTAVWLVLNSLFLGIRSRPATRNGFLAAAALCLSVGLTANWLLAEQNLGRIDLTEDKLYTLSPASRRILRQLPDPVQVSLYITPRQQLPITMRYLERDIRDQLDDMRLAGEGNLHTQVVHLQTAEVIRPAAAFAAPDDATIPDVQQHLLDQGVRPFSMQVLQGDDIVNKLVYAAIGVAYKDKPEAIIPRLLPRDLETLEYRLINLIDKLHRDSQPVVALVAPRDPLHLPEYMRELYAQMGRSLPETEDPYTVLERLLSRERYEVRRLESLADGVPPAAQTVAVLHPRRLPAEDKLLLRKALHAGKSVFLAVQQYRWNYTLGRQDVSITQEPQHPEVNDWLQQYGIAVDPDVLMDVNHQAMTVHDTDTLVDALVGSGVTLDLPLHMTIPQQAMNGSVSITSRLAPLFYLWGSALSLQPEVLRDHGLRRHRSVCHQPARLAHPRRCRAHHRQPGATTRRAAIPPGRAGGGPVSARQRLSSTRRFPRQTHRGRQRPDVPPQLPHRRQRRPVSQQHRRPHPRRGPHPRSRQEAHRPHHQPTHRRGPAFLEIRHRGGHQSARRHNRGHGRSLSPPATAVALAQAAGNLRSWRDAGKA